MNHYGRLAMSHTRNHRPRAFSQIQDLERHFGEVGERIQAAVTALRDQITGRQQPGETLLEYRRRAHQALWTAEETVLDDLAWLPAEPKAREETDPDLAAYRRQLAVASRITNS